MYPLKFVPVFKDYIWGGRNLKKFGKKLPPNGIIAESWEISCHPNGMSVVANGVFKGMTLQKVIDSFGQKIIGNQLSEEYLFKFPLLVKFLDSNKKISVQVHPDDLYAKLNENGALGKNEMWYIISAKPGSKLIYGVDPSITKDIFVKLVEENRIDEGLNYVDIYPGDMFYIPAGIVHGTSDGVVLAEVQQNSDITYRIYDYNRVDEHGKKRELHIEKALDVINFNASLTKSTGLKIKIGVDNTRTIKIANKYFAVEFYEINSCINENADGNKFYIYIITDGKGEVIFGENRLKIKMGESILIPASMGKYKIKGNLKMLKTYVPELKGDVIKALKRAGYTMHEIYADVSGLKN